MKSERLGLDVEIEIVAEALPGFGAMAWSVGFGRTKQTETHYT